MKRPSPAARQILAAELESLPDLSTSALREKWEFLSGTPASPGLNRFLLIRVIAYRLQERAFGGLKPSSRARLDQAISTLTGDSAKVPARRQLKPGSRLLREWHGTTHEVIVTHDGMLYQNKRYRSLSEVAGIITGGHWSGPMFFGLVKSRRDRR
jgi:hypothetical protein